jgi:hypothetical protein
MTAPLFNFRLRDWDKVEPWTFTDGTKSLSWFGFTDGWYWMTCGREELFHYTPDILAEWSGGELPYCDYQLARLWEDVLQILPRVLDPVPHDLAVILANEMELARWSRQRTVWFENTENVDEIENEATDWVGGRFLDSLYLVQGPQIILWRTDDLIHIRWNNSGKALDGVPVWTATSGTHEMPVEVFLSEIESFHCRFMTAMRDRVNSITARWNRADVQIDLERLVEEQGERETALQEALVVQHETDWESVRQGARILNSFRPPSVPEQCVTKELNDL